MEIFLMTHTGSYIKEGKTCPLKMLPMTCSVKLLSSKTSLIMRIKEVYSNGNTVILLIVQTWVPPSFQVSHNVVDFLVWQLVSNGERNLLSFYKNRRKQTLRFAAFKNTCSVWNNPFIWFQEWLCMMLICKLLSKTESEISVTMNVKKILRNLVSKLPVYCINLGQLPFLKIRLKSGESSVDLSTVVDFSG